MKPQQLKARKVDTACVEIFYCAQSSTISSYVQVNISPELDLIIRESVPIEHELDLDTEFDPIVFLDRKFPGGATAEVLHEYAESLRKEIKDMETNPCLRFQDVALRSANADKTSKDSRVSLSSLQSQLMSIHERVIASEQSMRRASDDLISLNLARTNVSYTITLLKKIVMAVGACDQLVELARTREYRQMSALVHSLKHLGQDSFLAHRSIDRVDELLTHMDRIFKDIGDQVKDDFLGGSEGVDFSGAGETAESLGIESEITDEYCSRIIQSYEGEFSPFDGNSVSSSFSEHEKRFVWLSKSLSDLKEKKVFPVKWLVSGNLCLYFCHATRRHFTQLLEDESGGNKKIIPEIVIKCVDLESDMQRRFDKLAGKSLSFIGAISKCFGTYMRTIWIPAEEENLIQKLEKLKSPKIVECDNDPPVLFENAIQMMGMLRDSVRDVRKFKLDDVLLPSLGGVFGNILVWFAEFFLHPIIATKPLSARSSCAVVGTCDYLVEAAANLGAPVGPLDEILVCRKSGIDACAKCGVGIFSVGNANFSKSFSEFLSNTKSWLTHSHYRSVIAGACAGITKAVNVAIRAKESVDEKSAEQLLLEIGTIKSAIKSVGDPGISDNANHALKKTECFLKVLASPAAADAHSVREMLQALSPELTESEIDSETKKIILVRKRTPHGTPDPIRSLIGGTLTR